MSYCRWALSAILTGLLWHSSDALLSAQKVRIDIQLVTPERIAERLKRLHARDEERERELTTMFAEAGCSTDNLEEQIVRRKGPPNVLCTMPGATSSRIIVSAHFDHAGVGDGAVDDWSGASLLPSLYQALKQTERKHTFQFVGFTDEEKGLAGSSYYVKQLTKDQLAAIKAVVNLECLGLSPSEVWPDVANQQLLEHLFRVARSLHLPLSGVSVTKVGDDDTHPFRNEHVPTLTIHSITQETISIVHSNKDKLSAVHADSLYDSYHLVAAYLAFLDQVLD